MAVADLFNVEKQLTFYGAYHTNKVNIGIHILCVPMIVWSFQALIAPFQLPSFIPAYRHVFNEYMVFDTNYATAMGAIYLGYYYMLEPVAAFLYTPQMILTVLTATAYAEKTKNPTLAYGIHIFSWIAQFAGHGIAEGRAPALLDNLLGAVVLAPFFVHLETLFGLGYRPAFHKRIQNSIGKEVAKIRRTEGDKKRAAAATKSE